MSAPGRVTAEELVRALKKRRATLPAEIGSFVVLEACEALQSRGSFLLSPANVEISDEGTIWLGEAKRVGEQEAAYALHRLLAAVLVAAGPAPHPALMRLLERGPSNGCWTVASIHDNLEASLVPLNRGASRRVLARFVREIGWAERPSKRPSFDDLDSELSSFLGADNEPEPLLDLQLNAARQRSVPPDEVTRGEPVESVDDSNDQLRFVESVRPIACEPTGKTVLDVSPSHAERIAPHLAKSPEQEHRAPLLSYRPRVPRELEAEEPRRGSSTLLIGSLMLLLSAAVLAVTLSLRPELLSRLTTPAEPPRVKQPAEVVIKRPMGGDLEVRVANERAQILRFVGRGPVTVEHLPLGVAHEFVATAEGMMPARLLVASNAEWESTAEGKRYEAAMQLSQLSGQISELELGETLLPQDVGSPSATLGSLRIVTTPKGAKVYQVIGFAPQALVQDLPVDATQELLIYRKGHAPEVRVVAPSDYLEEAGRKRAVLDIKLVALPKSR